VQQQTGRKKGKNNILKKKKVNLGRHDKFGSRGGAKEKPWGGRYKLLLTSRKVETPKSDEQGFL